MLRTKFIKLSTKRANVVPLFKAGDRTDASNYRPISLLPLFSKVFEKVIYNKVFNHIKPFIDENQHGFVSGRSTATNLLSYTQYISSIVDKGGQVDSIYLDFSKAFDSVNHVLLIHKLQSYSICGNLLNWLSSYLNGRLQRVAFDGELSAWRHVSSGVPQGSILGPLLFVLYINDMSECLNHANLSLYADDSKLFMSIAEMSDCVRLQRDINQVVKWTEKWKLSLNFKKCSCISFTKKHNASIFPYRFGKRMDLNRTDFVKDLGVLLTSKLNWSMHINQIVAKSFKMLGFIKRTCKSFSSIRVLKTLYVSFVRSQVEYCSPIWSPHQVYLIQKLERVQKKFIKYLCARSSLDYSREMYNHLCHEFHLPTLESRRKFLDTIFLFKILSGYYSVPDVLAQINFNIPSFTLRHTDLFRPTSARTNILKYSFLSRTQTFFNAIRTKCNIDIFDDFNNFRHVLRNFLFTESF